MGLFDLPERVEDPLEVVRCDADARVTDLEADRLEVRSDHERDSTTLAELDRVREQVDENLSELDAISHDRLRIAGRSHVDSKTLRAGERPCNAVGLIEDFRYIDRLESRFLRSRLEAREGQQLVDEAQQVPGTRLDAQELLALPI